MVKILIYQIQTYSFIHVLMCTWTHTKTLICFSSVLVLMYKEYLTLLCRGDKTWTLRIIINKPANPLLRSSFGNKEIISNSICEPLKKFLLQFSFIHAEAHCLPPFSPFSLSFSFPLRSATCQQQFQYCGLLWADVTTNHQVTHIRALRYSLFMIFILYIPYIGSIGLKI